MLQSMREGAQSTTAKVIIGLIILSFAGFGLESLIPSGAGGAPAEVNGVEISENELFVAIENRKRQLEQVFGEQIQPELLDSDRLRPVVLETLIEREVLLQHARESGLTASDQLIGKYVADIEAFKVDGRFSPEQYKFVLANAGYTPELFRRTTAEDIVLEQLQNALTRSDFVTQRELAAAVSVLAEERDIRFLSVNAAQVLGDNQVSEEEVLAFYNENPDQFMSEAGVNAEYILLTPEQFMAPVSEAELQEQFEAVKGDYEVADQTSVAHILLTQRDDESDGGFALRVAQVEEALTDSANAFRDLAQQFSDDIGSASLGGELGLTDGSVFPEEMEAAIAQTEVNEVSPPVVTDAGTHFIKVLERIPGRAPDFEQMRGELEAAISASAAQQALLTAVDQLKEISFNSLGLTSSGDALGVDVQTAEAVTPAQGAGLFADDRVRAALFAPEVFEDGNNSPVIELDGNAFAVVRVAEKLPAKALSLEAVRERIVDQLTEQRLEGALATLEGEINAALATGETIEEIAKARSFEWQVELGARRDNSVLPAPIRRIAFSMAADPKRVERVVLAGDRFALVQLARVKRGRLEELNSQEIDAIKEQMRQVATRQAFADFTSALVGTAEIIKR
jgi:peptidyl-prolyl cis-trans isomerase D